MTERTAADLADAYITALQAHDKQGILSILADDFELIVPCDVSGANDLTQRWSGLQSADVNYEATFRKIVKLKYVDIEITPGRDDTVAFLEGLGEMMLDNGNPYCNRYIFRFDTENGKIRRIREYLNPITAAIAMEIPLPRN
ncbi:MAG: nuclear transport factor 2 family protein [Novosphingobium sp.]